MVMQSVGALSNCRSATDADKNFMVQARSDLGTQSRTEQMVQIGVCDFAGFNRREALMSHEDIEAREKFLFTLEWLLAVTKRHTGGMQFGLAHINYETPKVLGETFGAQRAAQKLDDVSHSLRRSFRKSDLVARDGADFWILVPFAPAEEKLVDKIRYIIDTASQGGLQIVERDISIFLLPNDAAEVDASTSATEFLTYLKKNHITLARHELSLPARE